MDEPGPAFLPRLLGLEADLVDHKSAIQTHTIRKLRVEDIAEGKLIVLEGSKRLYNPDPSRRLHGLNLDLSVSSETGRVSSGADGVLDEGRVIALLVETCSEAVDVLTEVLELVEVGSCTNDLACEGLGGVFENAREALDDGGRLTREDGILALVVHYVWI